MAECVRDSGEALSTLLSQFATALLLLSQWHLQFLERPASLESGSHQDDLLFFVLKEQDKVGWQDTGRKAASQPCFRQLMSPSLGLDETVLFS